MARLAQLQLETLFVFDDKNRIVSTREPHATSGPLFMLIRSRTGCAWAIRAGVSERTAAEVNRLAMEEPPFSSPRDAPLHADRYQSIFGGCACSGPAFIFPREIIPPPDAVPVFDEQLLSRHFSGWVGGEIRAGRAPVMVVMDQGYPVSICFCARRSDTAAEAGVETTPEYRGRGLASHATAAWALAIRASGRIPLYSTDWSNEASLGVARKLALEIAAVDWSISGGNPRRGQMAAKLPIAPFLTTPSLSSEGKGGPGWDRWIFRLINRLRRRG
jgi:hypothetical protein